ESLLLPALAVVGSRKPSMAGKQHAYSFAYELSLQGQNVVSGLALGVDTLAHRGALEASGITCAVLGTGLDLVYPRQNQKLAEQIMDRGVLVSEMALGSLPVPANFPRRNRLISGLSQGSLIVEAGLKSGSLITANYAIEQNREVYVIPGPIDSEVAAGCNDLIKQGAQLVTCVEDILAFPCRDSCMTVASSANNSKRESPIGRSTSAIVGKAEGHAAETQLSHELLPDEGKLLPLIDFQCTSFDVLASESQLEAGVLLQNLVSLELKGLISNVPGGYQRVKSVNSA
ncbi:DNA-processing protein DprA, partial [Oleiphilus sp. HI0128]